MGKEKMDLRPYILMIHIYIVFVAAAFFFQSPAELLEGMYRILRSRSILITDYMEIGGIGATLLNAVLVGSLSIIMLLRARVKPDGSVIMALWLTTGFSLFGKNIFNMLPITFGVWLYARVRREPFRNYAVAALLSATVSPVVSVISFLGIWEKYICVCVAVAVGIFVGFLFPCIAAFCARVHGGYCLYNMGFAGGLISSFILAIMQSLGVEVESVLIWSTGNNNRMGGLLYLIAFLLIAYGAVHSDRKTRREKWREIMAYRNIEMRDFYTLAGNSIYINMGLLCTLGTSLVLVIGGDLNGPTISGIFTMTGFAAYGKHIKNVIPPIAGAVLCTFLNITAAASPNNMLAILFASGLAPIAGTYGRLWGGTAGFLHVIFVVHIKYLNSGMNLYNNGFAAGFVALVLLPVITAFQRPVKSKEAMP